MVKAAFVPPMLASSSGPVVTEEDWILERKLDGLRCLAVRNGDEVELWSRNELPFTPRFAAIVTALRELSPNAFVLDGEIVAFDANGNTSFSLLQQGGSPDDAVFVAFDVLHLMSHDTRGLLLEARTKLLDSIIDEGPNLAIAERLVGNPQMLLDGACQKGWEGLVAKRRGEVYKGGRSQSWRKLKCMASQELVIGGWTAPKGVRQGFGAVLVGYYDGDAFRYAGKVGTGFTAATIALLFGELQAREVNASPFVGGEGERGAHWVRPELVANVTFSEWTGDGRLRHPSFDGLRPDKPALDVVREQSRSAPRPPR